MRTSRTSIQGALQRAISAEGYVSEHRSWPQALAVLAAIAGALAVALSMFVPPAVVAADAPDNEFSAARSCSPPTTSATRRRCTDLWSCRWAFVADS